MQKSIYLYSFGAWLILVFLAIANGIIRNSYYSGQLGELAAHQLSTVIFCIIIIAFSYVFFRYSGVSGEAKDYLYVGLMWLFLTVIFEFIFGHYIAGHSWDRLLEDYNLFKGRIWLLVLIVTFSAPSVAFWLIERGKLH